MSEQLNHEQLDDTGAASNGVEAREADATPGSQADEVKIEADERLARWMLTDQEVKDIRRDEALAHPEKPDLPDMKVLDPGTGKKEVLSEESMALSPDDRMRNFHKEVTEEDWRDFWKNRESDKKERGEIKINAKDEFERERDKIKADRSKTFSQRRMAIRKAREKMWDKRRRNDRVSNREIIAKNKWTNDTQEKNERMDWRENTEGTELWLAKRTRNVAEAGDSNQDVALAKLHLQQAFVGKKRDDWEKLNPETQELVTETKNEVVEQTNDLLNQRPRLLRLAHDLNQGRIEIDKKGNVTVLYEGTKSRIAKHPEEYDAKVVTETTIEVDEKGNKTESVVVESIEIKLNPAEAQIVRGVATILNEEKINPTKQKDLKKAYAAVNLEIEQWAEGDIEERLGVLDPERQKEEKSTPPTLPEDKPATEKAESTEEYNEAVDIILETLEGMETDETPLIKYLKELMKGNQPEEPEQGTPEAEALLAAREAHQTLLPKIEELLENRGAIEGRADKIRSNTKAGKKTPPMLDSVDAPAREVCAIMERDNVKASEAFNRRLIKVIEAEVGVTSVEEVSAEETKESVSPKIANFRERVNRLVEMELRNKNMKRLMRGNAELRMAANFFAEIVKGEKPEIPEDPQAKKDYEIAKAAAERLKAKIGDLYKYEAEIKESAKKLANGQEVNLDGLTPLAQRYVESLRYMIENPKSFKGRKEKFKDDEHMMNRAFDALAQGIISGVINDNLVKPTQLAKPA